MTKAEKKQQNKVLTTAYSFGDQAFFSATNFLLTVTLAHFYAPRDLAAYAIGLSVALVLTGVLRIGYVVPTAVLSEGRFRSRAKQLNGLSVFLVLVPLLASAFLYFIGNYGGLAISGDYVAATLSCILIYLPADFNRTMLLRSGHVSASLQLSVFYFFVMFCIACLSVYGWMTFHLLLGLQAVCGILRMAFAGSRTGGWRLGGSNRLALHMMKRNWGWSIVGVIAATAFNELPIFILGSYGRAIETAAFLATRSPLQPLLIVVRSLDIVDKIRLGAARVLTAQRVYRLFFTYASVAVIFATIVSFNTHSIINLVVGKQYSGYTLCLLLWCGVFVLSVSFLPFETVIVRCNQMRAYAMIQVAGGLLALCSAIIAIKYWGAAGAISSCIIGYVAVASLSWLLLVKPTIMPLIKAQAQKV